MPGPGGCLFLDLSRAGTGWAYSDSLDQVPDCGEWELQGDEYSFGRTWTSLDNKLAAAIKLLRPVRIGIEAPLPAHAQTTPLSGRLALGLTATAEQTCYRFSIECQLLKVETLRSQVIGRAYLNDQEKRAKLNVKSAIVGPWVASMGWLARTHNAADALVGLAFMLGHRARPARRKAA